MYSTLTQPMLEKNVCAVAGQPVIKVITHSRMLMFKFSANAARSLGLVGKETQWP
jgi:hypothetical protein